VRLTTDGSIEVSVTIGDEMKVHPWQPVAGAAATEVTATSALMPEPKTTTFDTTMIGTYTPKVNGVTVTTVAGGGHSVAVTGKAVTVTVQIGVTTKANLDADWAASAAALALATFSVTAGTVAAGYVGVTLSLWTARTINVAAETLLTPSGTQVPALGDADGNAQVQPVLPVAGADPTPVVGTLGRLNQDYTYAIAAGKTIRFHPLVHGVSVVVATDAAEAVNAAGLVVTFTDLNTDLSTVTTMRAALAASNAAGLVSIELGTAVGGDTWDHLLTLAETPLWASGTHAAGAVLVLGPDGYMWPAETDSTGGIKVSQSSLLFSEDGSRNVMRTEHQGTETGRSAVSAIVVAAGTAGRIYGHVLEAGAGGATFTVRKDAVIGGAIIAQFVLAANAYDLRDWPDWPFGNGLYCEIAAGGGAFNFVVRNT
jgi:hypothetical protein